MPHRPVPAPRRPRPELPDSDLREQVAGNYRLVYRVRGKRVEILTVIEAHQRFPEDDLPEEE